jgi:hypothetical protein
MASLLSPRRTDPTIVLRTTVAQSERAPLDSEEPDAPRVAWWLVALGGAWSAVLCGWVIVAGVTVLGWLAADTQTFAGALRVGTQLWLLANGVGVRLGSTVVTLVPWGATLAMCFLVSRFAGAAARQHRGRPLVGALGVTAVVVAAYAVPVAVTALLTGVPRPDVRALVGVSAALLLAAWWGSIRSLGYRPTGTWPAWCQALPRAVTAAQLAMLLTGAAALVTGLVVHLNRVLALTESLQTGVVGGIALWLVQLAFVPGGVVWAGSYTLGAGFSLGQGSVVALAATEHGLLPSVPLLGALPGAGAGQVTHLWWLVGGAVAGASAAWVMVRARPTARFDETSLVGALAGVLGGLVFVVLAWASGGDLGSSRLAGLGPRLLPLLMLSVTTMGLAGMFTGLVLGLLRLASR